MKGASLMLSPANQSPLTRDGMRRKSHWFHTIMITRVELDRTFTNAAMKQR